MQCTAVQFYFHAMTVSEEVRMVRFGGVDDIDNNTRINCVFSCWYSIPSLKFVPWEVGDPALAVRTSGGLTGLLGTSRIGTEESLTIT